MTSGQNWVTFQFATEDSERPKTQKLPFLSRSIESRKLYNISKNQLQMLIRKRDRRVWPWKRPMSPPFPHQSDMGSWNLVCTFRKSSWCTLWWYRLFSLIEPPHSPKMCFFGRFSIFFPKTKMIYSAWYRQKLLQFGQSAQFGGGLYNYIQLGMSFR